LLIESSGIAEPMEVAEAWFTPQHEEEQQPEAERKEEENVLQMLGTFTIC